MKFLAILKDSFREAIDSKVLYFMVGLSLLAILFVASIGYRPLPAQDAFAAILTDLSHEQGNPFLQRKAVFANGKAIDVRQLDQAAQPYLGEYQFTVTGDWRPAGQTVTADEFLRKKFELYDIEVLSIKDGAKTATWDVHARGVSGRSWLHETTILFGAWKWPVDASLGRAVFFIEDSLINGPGAWVALLVSIIVTAFFIPNMLQKGTIDLLLSKPIGRTALLVYKYVGGLTFMFVNSAFAVGGIWFVLCLRTGIWAPQFLLSIFVLTYYFAVFYAISTLIGVLTRSAVIAILIATLLRFLFWLIGKGFAYVEFVGKVQVKELELPEWLNSTLRALHVVTPRTTDLDYLITRSLADNLLRDAERKRLMLDQLIPDFTWTESLGVSAAFIVALLGLSCWRFATRDY